MPNIKELRQLDNLFDHSPTIWETHSLYNDDDDAENFTVKYDEVVEDLKDWFGFSDELLREMWNLDFIEINNDAQGVRIIWWDGDTEDVDRLGLKINCVLNREMEKQQTQ